MTEDGLSKSGDSRSLGAKRTNESSSYARGFLLLQIFICSLLMTSSAFAEDVISSCSGAETAVSRLFLQQVSAHSAMIKWRGAVSYTHLTLPTSDLV